jgi:hypothetical protein
VENHARSELAQAKGRGEIRLIHYYTSFIPVEVTQLVPYLS